jgi:hypothetical protein
MAGERKVAPHEALTVQRIARIAVALEQQFLIARYPGSGTRPGRRRAKLALSRAGEVLAEWELRG